MIKKINNKKRVMRVVSFLASFVVLFFLIIIPASAFVNPDLDSSSRYNLEAIYPVKNFSVSSMAYGYDPNEEDSTTYFNIDAVYDLFIPTIISVDSDLTNKLTEMRADTTTDYTSIDLLTLETVNNCNASGFLSEDLSGFRYSLAHTLTYYKTWVPQAQINLYKPKLPLVTSFNSYVYNGQNFGFEFSSDKTDSIVIEFEEYLVYNKYYNRSYIQFDSQNFPLGVSNYICYVTYDYDLVSVDNVGGEPTLVTQHVNTTVAADAWNAQRRAHAIPYFSENQVIKNLVTKINFRTRSQEVVTWVPSNFQYIQPVDRDPDIDAFEFLDDFNTVEKWRDITDLTSWLGETVSDFFDIELFPGIRLSNVLGITLSVAVTLWLLKLMAGG